VANIFPSANSGRGWPIGRVRVKFVYSHFWKGEGAMHQGDLTHDIGACAIILIYAARKPKNSFRKKVRMARYKTVPLSIEAEQ